jgi:hypothetical protein
MRAVESRCRLLGGGSRAYASWEHAHLVGHADVSLLSSRQAVNPASELRGQKQAFASVCGA